MTITFVAVKPARKRRHRLAVLADRPDLLVGGGIVQMVQSLPKEVAVWLVGQVPEDSTLNELIASIIVDAYHDEKGE